MHEALLSSVCLEGGTAGLKGFRPGRGGWVVSLVVANNLALGSGVPDKLLQQGIEGPAESRGDPVSAVHVSHRGCCHPCTCHCQPLNNPGSSRRAGQPISSGRADDPSRPSRSTPPAARSVYARLPLPVYLVYLVYYYPRQGSYVHES